MFQGLQGWHFIVLVVVVLVLFGAPKLPGLARSIGQSMRIFRSEVRTMKDENAEADADAATDEPVVAAEPAPKATSKSKPTTGASKPKS